MTSCLLCICKLLRTVLTNLHTVKFRNKRPGFVWHKKNSVKISNQGRILGNCPQNAGFHCHATKK